jgi:hypothetical protein
VVGPKRVLSMTVNNFEQHLDLSISWRWQLYDLKNKIGSIKDL